MAKGKVVFVKGLETQFFCLRAVLCVNKLGIIKRELSTHESFVSKTHTQS